MGGAEEKEAELRKGNFWAKDWKKEAETLLETTVSTIFELILPLS
jgi:hypothetical protein